MTKWNIVKQENNNKDKIPYYGSETWKIIARQKRKAQAVEMDTIRRSTLVSRRYRIKNGHIKQHIGIESTMVQNIEKKQLTSYRHVECQILGSSKNCCSGNQQEEGNGKNRNWKNRKSYKIP